jgi:hypothetical protein
MDNMQDAAAFYPQRARASFYRRRKYPVNSEEWKHAVQEARQFIGYYRAQTYEDWPHRTADEKLHAAWLLTCAKYGIDPNTRLDKSRIRRLPFPEGENDPDL